jgi:ribosomal protein S18 acetylase RimI-like enzyme
MGSVQHDDMSTPAMDRIRAATAADVAQLLLLWALVFDEDDAAPVTWRQHAQEWFTCLVEDRTTARFPVIDVDGDVVATAIGTLELGVPNPQCPRGRTVRLANVITLPEHRGRGYGTLLVRDVIGWARSIEADRVDLSATPDGQRIYEKVGFNLTKAPRMKLVL